MEQRKFIPHTKPLPEKARKVKGGLKFAPAVWPPELSWAASRWIAGVMAAALPEDVQAGLEYARSGQTRTLSLEPGRVVGEVQGRAFRPLRAVLEINKFSDEQWHAVETTMTEQAVYAAKLLSHEVPQNIQEVFAPLGLSLYPQPGSSVSEMPDLRVSCTCGHPTPWCKHAVCVALLLADRIDHNPFLIFTLRGLPGDELIERLRTRRAAAQGGDMFTQSLAQRLGALGGAQTLQSGEGADTSEGTGPASSRSLEACLDEFWDLGPGLEELETPLRAPEVSHVLLRRLGPSPFKDGKFPLVGLLATCYETISKSAMEGMPGGLGSVPAPGSPAPFAE